MELLLWNSNLFTNPGFTKTGSLSSGIDEWDGVGATYVSVNGPELTASGNPLEAWVVGGMDSAEGPWGVEQYASKVQPLAGTSYTFAVLVSSNAPDVKISVGLGSPYIQGEPPVVLTSQDVKVTEGIPTTRALMAFTVPADYVFDGTNGLTVTLHSLAGSYVRIRTPWVGLTSDVPTDPVPPVEPPAETVLDPLAARVAANLARKGERVTEELATEHLALVRSFVFGYTRGRGFAMQDPMKPVSILGHVIVSACMRLTPNPEQLDSYTAGDYSERGATLKGFTLPELAVLNNYRRRTG